MIPIDAFEDLRTEEILNRSLRAEASVDEAVDAILADVRRNGDEALRRYAAQFDGAELERLAVTEEEISAAMETVDGDFLRTLELAAANIRAFHEQQVHRDLVLTKEDGGASAFPARRWRSPPPC